MKFGYFMEFALARGAAVWRGLERGIDTFSLGNVISLRSRAADLRRSLDTVIMHADRRTDQLSQGKTQMKMPDDADWGWRPDVFATRLGQMSSVVKSARHDVGTSIAVHHNDTDPELIVRQFKNMGVDDLAPFGLSVETYEFKGSFLSLAIDLPSEAAMGLTKNHIFEVEGKLSLDHPMPVFVRSNVKHGPNVEELFQEIPHGANRLYLEFDLGYCDLHEARVENVWLDLIFDDPSMNRAKISDLVFYRRPRAKF